MTAITLTVVVTLAGAHAADVVDDLGIDVDAGELDQAMTNLLRAHLANHNDTRDWRIVRATVTPVDPEVTRRSDEPPAVDTVAAWRHRRSGERYIVELSDGHVVNAVGPVYHGDIEAMLDTGDWTGDPELAEDIEAHQDDYAEVTP